MILANHRAEGKEKVQRSYQNTIEYIRQNKWLEILFVIWFVFSIFPYNIHTFLVSFRHNRNKLWVTFKSTLFEKATLYDQAHWFNLISDSVINVDCSIAEWTSLNKRRACSLADMSRIFTSKCIKIKKIWGIYKEYSVCAYT